MNELFERIETMCKNRGTNITKLCKASGAPRGSLTDLKSGRISTLGAGTLDKIAGYFGITVDELLGRTASGDAELDRLVDVIRTRPECKRLIETLSTADTAEVELAIKLLETIKTANFNPSASEKS